MGASKEPYPFRVVGGCSGAYDFVRAEGLIDMSFSVHALASGEGDGSGRELNEDIRRGDGGRSGVDKDRASNQLDDIAYVTRADQSAFSSSLEE